MSELQSDSIAKIMPALIKAKRAFKPALKDATNPAFRSKYSTLDSVIDAVDGALLSNGIANVQQTYVDGENTILLSRFIHESGEWIGSRYRVKPVQATPQGEGSALTYARRYALLALAGIAPEDDDGQAASVVQQQRPAPRPAPQPAVDPETVLDWELAIDKAGNPVELAKVGTDMAAAHLPSATADRLRAKFTRRMTELRAAAS